MNEPRVVLLTGNERRHAYVAQELSKALVLGGIVTEVKAPWMKDGDRLESDDARIVRAHLEERHAVEARLLGAPSMPSVPLLAVEHGGSNDVSVMAWVAARQPDYVLLYGTSIIKPPLLDAFPGRMINMHLGLSPYYRGTATNFWPLVDAKPECVGVTLHLAIAKVDAGAVLAQVRPDVEGDDRAHEVGTKSIVVATALWPKVLDAYRQGRITPRAQVSGVGRLCRRKDFDASAVRTLWANFAAGMIPNFLGERRERLARYPIIEP